MLEEYPVRLRSRFPCITWLMQEIVLKVWWLSNTVERIRIVKMVKHWTQSVRSVRTVKWLYWPYGSWKLFTDREPTLTIRKERQWVMLCLSQGIKVCKVRKAISQFVRICRIVNRLTSRTNGTIRRTVGRSGQQASAIGDHLLRLRVDTDRDSCLRSVRIWRIVKLLHDPYHVDSIGHVWKVYQQTLALVTWRVDLEP